MIHRLAGAIMIFYSGHFHNKVYRISPSDSHIEPVASGRAWTFFSVSFQNPIMQKKKKRKTPLALVYTSFTAAWHMEQGCGDNLSFLRWLFQVRGET